MKGYSLKIGVFDSGIGGLLVSNKLKEKLPYDQIIFRSDSEHMPYGNKDENLIIDYSNKIISLLEKDGAEFIIVACGTISSLIPKLNHNVRLEGIIDPLCISSCNITKNKKVGVIATVNTIKSESFPNCIRRIDENIEVYTYPCYDLATLIENRSSEVEILSSLKEPIDYFEKAKIDTLILGCTHYSWILDLIREKIPGVNIVDFSELVSSSIDYLKVNRPKS